MPASPWRYQYLVHAHVSGHSQLSSYRCQPKLIKRPSSNTTARPVEAVEAIAASSSRAATQMSHKFMRDSMLTNKLGMETAGHSAAQEGISDDKLSWIEMLTNAGDGAENLVLLYQTRYNLFRRFREYKSSSPNPHLIIPALHCLLKRGLIVGHHAYLASELIMWITANKEASRQVEADGKLLAMKRKILELLTQETPKMVLPSTRKLMEAYVHVCLNPTQLLGQLAGWFLGADSKWLRNHDRCFRLIAAAALVHAPSAEAKAAWLHSLCHEIFPHAAQKVFYSQGLTPMWSSFYEALNSDESGDSLMTTFFDNMALQENFEPKLPDFRAYIEPALKKHSRWRLYPSQLREGSDRCDVCNHELERITTTNALSPEEFIELCNEFEALLLAELGEKSGEGALAEYNALMWLVRRLLAVRKPEKTPIVVDGPNLVYGALRKAKMSVCSGVHKALSQVAQDPDYSPILAIRRLSWPSKEKHAKGEFIEATRSLPVHLFTVDDSLPDDLFMIRATMMLGADALLMTNDEFADHANRFRQPSSRRLFEMWSRSNIIRMTNELQCLYPSMRYKGVQKSPCGYHLLVQQCDERGNKFNSLPSFYCLQTGLEQGETTSNSEEAMPEW